MSGNITATSYRKANGKDWEISTYKSDNGILKTVAQSGKRSPDGRGFSFAMFSDPREVLIREQARATEKAVQDQHNRALKVWEEMVKAKGWSEEGAEAIIKALQPGQIVWLNGYGQSKGNHERQAIYEISAGSFGHTVKLVNLETLDLNEREAETIRPDSQIFGIGTYYTPGDTVPMEEVRAALEKAKDKQARKQEEAARAKEEAARQRAEDIRKGSEILPAVPVGAGWVIIAELHEDRSDIYTDYFASEVTRVIYLNWSRHGRDLFDEMRKAAALCDIPEVNKYSQPNPEDEHREKYSMGHGYYLGAHRHSGWHIRKIKAPELETLQIAAAQGRLYCPGTLDEATEPQNYEAIPTAAGKVHIVDYSEKAIAVIGDTKPIKDRLKAMGGRFNFRLSCGPGWIFSKSRLQDVCEALNIRAAEDLEPEEIDEEEEEAAEDYNYNGPTGHGDICYSDADPGL